MSFSDPDLTRELRQVDPDRAFLSLFAPDACRAAVQVIDLWNAELARVVDDAGSLTEGARPMGALFRLQWWRDELDKVCRGQGGADHPLLLRLAPIIAAHHLPFELFDAVLQGRCMDLDLNGQAPSDLIAYADATHGAVMRIKARLLSLAEAEAQVLSDLSVRYAVVGLIRSLTFHAGQGRVVLPGLSVTDIFPGSEVLRSVVSKACAAVSRPEGASSVRYLRAMEAFTELHLRAIARAGYDPFRLAPVPFMELRVWMRS